MEIRDLSKRTGAGFLSRPPSDENNHAFTRGAITMTRQTPNPYPLPRHQHVSFANP
jgi:hypothetical protein